MGEPKTSADNTLRILFDRTDAVCAESAQVNPQVDASMKCKVATRATSRPWEPWSRPIVAHRSDTAE